MERSRVSAHGSSYLADEIQALRVNLGKTAFDPERARRRQFNAEYKARIVREADACRAPGEVGALRRRSRETMCILRWTSPGTVWAADFTLTPSPVDGICPKLLLIRDLASGAEFLAMPAHGERAEEVVLAFEGLYCVHGAPLVQKLDNARASSPRPCASSAPGTGS